MTHPSMSFLQLCLLDRVVSLLGDLSGCQEEARAQLSPSLQRKQISKPGMSGQTCPSRLACLGVLSCGLVAVRGEVSEILEMSADTLEDRLLLVGSPQWQATRHGGRQNSEDIGTQHKVTTSQGAQMTWLKAIKMRP